MFDTILTRLFPAAMLGGLALYLLATLLWLQPLVERRMAEKHLIPACEAALAHDQETTPLPRNPERDQIIMTITMLENMGADEIPFLREQLQAARAMLTQMQPQRLRISKVERDTICGCGAENAYQALGLGMTLHVASARTYTPSRIASLPHSTIAFAQSGTCGDLPWKG